MLDPYGPDFPLDGDIVHELEQYPGEMPTNEGHFVRLLSAAQRARRARR